MSISAAGARPRPARDPAAGYRRDLQALGDAELLALTASLPVSSQVREAALDLLVVRYRNLVRSCVRRYSRSRVSSPYSG